MIGPGRLLLPRGFDFPSPLSSQFHTQKGPPFPFSCRAIPNLNFPLQTPSPVFALSENDFGGTWVAQSVKRPTWAQVTISWFVSSSPALGSLLSAQSPLRILCPSPTCALSKINKTRGAWVAQSVKRPTSARSRSRGP